MPPISPYNQGAIFGLVPAGCDGIQEVTSSISLYPNPTSGALRVNYDLTGKLLIDNQLDGNNEINLSLLTDGIYLMKILDNGKIIIAQKLVKW